MFEPHDRRHNSHEEQAYRRSAAQIGWQVMILCAGLVIIGGIVILAFLFWQTTPAETNKPPQAHEVEVRLDPGELGFAVVLLAGGAILGAGLVARVIARRAVRPLDAAYQLQRRFVADASHELRTPLAVLTARLQQLSSLTPTEDPRAQLVADLRQDTRNMTEVIDSLLGESAQHHRPVDRAALHETIDLTTRELAGIAAKNGVTLSSECPEILVAMPHVTLRRCLIALIDNAIEHSPMGGYVRIIGSSSGTLACVTVHDEGGGIVGISTTDVFTRFARGRPASARCITSNTHQGIGLALVRELCEAHGADVRVQSTGLSGTVFEMRIPICTPETP